MEARRRKNRSGSGLDFFLGSCRKSRIKSGEMVEFSVPAYIAFSLVFSEYLLVPAKAYYRQYIRYFPIFS